MGNPRTPHMGQQPTPETAQKRSAAGTLPKHLFSILIIDDDQHLAGMLNRILSNAGYSCTCVFSAHQAMALCETRLFDLIITDIHMPEMSGVEFAEAIQKHAIVSMIIFMTANAELMSISRAMTLEPFGYLEKPFKNDRLFELVDKAYERFSGVVASESERAQLTSVVQKKEQELRIQSEQLLAGEELLQGIISNANFGLIAVDTHLTVSLLNEMACELLSQPAQDHASFVGSSIIRFLPDSCRPQLLALCQSVIRMQQPQERTFTNPVSKRLLNAMSYPIFRNETLQAAVLIIQDITEKELLQNNLLQSAKLASIGALSAGIAHEINTPLMYAVSNMTKLTQNINSLIDRAGQTEPSDTTAQETRQVLAEMNDGFLRVTRILQDLKSYAGPDDESPSQANINELLEKALSLVHNEIKKKLTVQTSYVELPALLCFPGRLVQVFTNIFINAAQATEKKGSLTITTASTDEYIRIDIRDTGQGISEENLPHVLDPFFTTKKAGQGTGMGLSISHSIIQRHTGDIDVTSEIGKGTQVTIRLPLRNGLSQSQVYS